MSSSRPCLSMKGILRWRSLAAQLMWSIIDWKEWYDASSAVHLIACLHATKDLHTPPCRLVCSQCSIQHRSHDHTQHLHKVYRGRNWNLLQDDMVRADGPAVPVSFRSRSTHPGCPSDQSTVSGRRHPRRPPGAALWGCCPRSGMPWDVTVFKQWSWKQSGAEGSVCSV